VSLPKIPPMPDEAETPALQSPPQSQPPGKRGGSRLRRFFFRHVPLTILGGMILFALFAVVAYFIASSARFENAVRQRLIAALEDATGGRAEIASFHWRLLDLEAEADGIVIHGLEDPGDVPYAQIDRLRARISIIGVFTPRIRLRDLEIASPRLHLIVYPDGSTNQPVPRKAQNSNKQEMTQLFKLQASHVAVEQGSVHYENRAASFDYQNRYVPLDFEADDLSMVMHYVGATWKQPERYRIDAEAANLDLARSAPHSKMLPVHGDLKATVDLERTRLLLRSLRITAHRADAADHMLNVTGELDDFSHPRWQGRVLGDLDLRLLDPVLGYPDVPEGIAHLDLAAGGQAQSFRIDGGLHIDGGTYNAVGIHATGITLDAKIHGDPDQVTISQIVARLRQGGQIEGSIDLHPWLPGAPPAVVSRGKGGRNEPPPDRNVLVRQPVVMIPVNGKVSANFKGVAIDSVMDMVAAPQYQRLGIDAELNGPATAKWTNGDGGNTAVTALFSLSPSSRAPQGEVPANGTIDGTYTQRDGLVDLRKLEIRLPGSQLEAHGKLGAYPLSRPSELNLDFHSNNLAEFDGTLRSLGLRRNGRAGTAALPVSLGGQVDFHGTWAGSMVKPQLAGTLKATQLSVEMPAPRNAGGPPQYVRLDSVQAQGSYSDSQIAILHAELLHGKSKLDLDGTLSASGAGFDGESAVHARIDGTNVDAADIVPILAAETGQALPVAGIFNTQLQMDGPLHVPSGSGSLQMEKGTVFGEQIAHLHMQGAVAGEEFKLTSATVNDAGGTLSAAGSYDFKGKRFQVEGHADGIDITKVGWVHQHNLDAVGKLTMSLSGSGTIAEPRLEGRATVSALRLGGQQFGTLELTAHTTGHSLDYTANTQFTGAELAVRGTTQMEGEYATNAQLEFSHFDIGALLTMEHLEAFRGESALAGTLTVTGPLAHPEQLRGEARLNELAVTIAGVQLKSEGGAHATLENSRVQLDPMHITGTDTDLRVHGDLALKGTQQLDLAAGGSINLKLAETLDPDLTASGTTTFQVEAHGPLQHPGLQGTVNFEDGALSFGDLPNGLSQLHGSLQFTQNRLEVRSLTAVSGGGQLNVAGFLAYERGIYADLSVTGKGVRIRYPQGVTSLADSNFRLQGSQSNLLLSGDVMITRFTVSPDLDLAALASQANSAVQAVAPPDALSNHIRLDVHISSSPQLNFQNAFAKLAGDVDVHLRGTAANPSLLGRISITQGSAMIAGTRYELQRGDITFTNPVRIEPVLDMSATAHIEDYDVTLGLNGPPQKMSVTYRSDPPMPEADVLSLLALGHTSNQQRLYTQQQQQSISNPTDALLGGALNATVSSRVQKLFGAGSVKLDPNYLGAFGNSTSRITVSEQLGRNVTLTYATDVNTTSQQLLQAEVAINRHVSVVVARDESGVFSMVIKATRRYR
jgi:translocation and assembly module TamB